VVVVGGGGSGSGSRCALGSCRERRRYDSRRSGSGCGSDGGDGGDGGGGGGD